jgi:hypothetical protein
MKNTKKLGEIIAIIAVIICSMGGCASSAIIFDGSIPADQMATFNIPGGTFDVIEFSGKPVRWFKASILSYTEIKVPSGNHAIKFNYYYDAANHINNQELTADFKAGHVYTLSGALAGGGFSKTTVTFRIVDDTQGVTDVFVTVNGLDQFNGKYIIFCAESEREGGFTKVVGARGLQKMDRHLGVQILNGIAEMPVYHYWATYTNYISYDFCTKVKFFISDEEVFTEKTINGRGQYTLDRISFKNGRASINFNDLRSN